MSDAAADRPPTVAKRRWNDEIDTFSVHDDKLKCRF